MGNFTFDVKKAKGTSDATQSDHIERKVIPHNADPTRTHLNMALVTYPDGVNGRDEAIAYRLKTAGIKRKITNDQVRVVRIVMSGTHEDMMVIYKNGKLGEWCQDSILRDADIAEESSNYIANQILQQASATLLATANQTPQIALQLL